MEAPIKKQVQKIEKKAEKKAEKIKAKTDDVTDISKCFYLVSKESLALTVSRVDKYAPRKTGVYNVFDYEFNNLKEQQWRYDKDKQVIYSNFYPNKVISEGANKNLFMFPFKGIKN